MSAAPIPASAIDRWTAGWDPDDASAFRSAIRAMDRVFLQHFSSRDGGRSKHTVSTRPMTPQLFDALFK